MPPAKSIEDTQRGYVIPIGGAEEKTADAEILERFCSLSGSENASIVIIPTASMLEDTGERYERIFKDLGVKKAVSIPIDGRGDAKRTDYVEALENATGVFITGGNQLRLSTILGGTPVARTLRRINAEGVHIAGTSAGAAIMPEHMIAGGESGTKTPTEDGVILAPGLGLTNRLIIDQHFTQRNRLGRLLTALSFNPFAIGIGLDEDTAAFIGPDRVFEVVGSGVVTVVDPSDLQYSSMGSVRSGEAVSLFGLGLHILAKGTRYDTTTRTALADDM